MPYNSIGNATDPPAAPHGARTARRTGDTDMHSSAHTEDRARRSGAFTRGRRSSTWMLLGLGLFGLGVLASACSSSPSSPGVASVGGSTTTDPQTAASTGSSATGLPTHADLLAYSQCMRAHGVSDFPDPSADGTLSISASPGSDLDPNNPTYEAAQKACQKDIPQPTKAQQANAYKDGLKMAQCMRAHGVPDFPDPTASGGIEIHGGPGSDLNPDSPTFEAAQNTCQKDLPGGGKGGIRIQTQIHGPAPGSGGASGTGTGG